MSMPAFLAAASVLMSCMVLTACGHTSTPPKFTLPEKMIAGYTSGANATVVAKAVDDGVNVIFWSFAQFISNSVESSFQSDYVAPIYKALQAKDQGGILHFVSFGGWNAPHQIAGSCGDANCSATKYATAFKAFDEEMKANVSGFPGFAGIDWDLEGNDALSSTYNVFDQETFELMIGISAAVQKDGYLVSMVPAQSYFDCATSEFSPSLKFQAQSAPIGWTYAGRNAYAVLYAKCPSCFDLVMVQIYEGYSRAGFDLYWNGSMDNVRANGWPRNGTADAETTIIKGIIECLLDGWELDFDGYMGLSNGTEVSVPPEKIVVALSNGWAGPGGDYKFPFFSGWTSGNAWCAASQQVRGFAYWDISDDASGEPWQQSLVRDLSSTMASCKTESATARDSTTHTAKKKFLGFV